MPHSCNPPRALIVDDEVAITELLAATLSRAGYQCKTAHNGMEALVCMAVCQPDYVLTDVRMPGVSGLELVNEIHMHYPETWSLVLTGAADVPTVVQALRFGAMDFLTKPFSLDELRQRMKAISARRAEAVPNRTSNVCQGSPGGGSVELVEEMHKGVVRALSQVLSTKHPETHAHSARVAVYATSLSSSLDMNCMEVESVKIAALLHDVGKVAVDSSVLDKSGSLDASEFDQIRTHPEESARIVAPVAYSAQTLDAIRLHHEHYDGTGYPEGLRGEDIPLAARIVSICDAYDAMTSNRRYRPALSSEEAIRRLRGGAGTQWDPDLVDRFIALLG